MRPIIEVPLDAIDNNPLQTRTLDEAHSAKLAQSIERDGLLQKPGGRVVDPSGDAVDPMQMSADDLATLVFERDLRIQIAFGHHRVAAFRLLAEEKPEQYATIPVEIASLTDEEMADMAMLENDERQDLSDIQRARSLRARKESFGWSNAELGRRYGLDPSTVRNLLRLLEALPEYAQQAVHDHDLSGRIAAALAAAYGLPDVLHAHVRPDELLEAAVEGASADRIRATVRQEIRSHTGSLAVAPFPYDHAFEGLAEADEVVSPTCMRCPLLVIQRKGGIDRRCPDQSCYDAKRDAWSRRRTQRKDGDDTRGYSTERTEKGSQSIDRRTGSPDKNSSHPRDIQVTEGPEGNVLASVSSVAESRSDDNRDTVNEAIIQPAIDVLATQIRMLNPKALAILFYRMQYGRPVEDEDWTREEVLWAIAEKLVEFELPYDAQYQPTETMQAVSGLLRQIDASLPWDEDAKEVYEK